MIKTWIKYLGIAALAFGAGAVAWNWWDSPRSRSVWTCSGVPGDGFSSLYRYYPEMNALKTRVDGYFANTSAYIGGGAFVSALQEGDITRGGYFWNDDRHDDYYVHIDYVIRKTDDPRIAEMTTHRWLEVLDEAAAEAVFGRDYLDQTALSKEDAVAVVRPCERFWREVR